MFDSIYFIVGLFTGTGFGDITAHNGYEFSFIIISVVVIGNY